MTHMSALIALAAISALLTPVVVHATGAAPKASAPAAQAAPAPVVAIAAPTPVAESAPVPCARKVKVIYAGYGEAHATACAVR